MSIDGTKIGRIAAEVMERVENEKPDDGEELSIGTVAVIVEVLADEEDGPGWSWISYRCSDVRPWVQAGLFGAATRAVWKGHVAEGDA